jgi:hypothetical protein
MAVACVLLAGVCTGCSDAFWDPGGIEYHLTGPQEVTQPQLQESIPFTATGVPVDDGVVCESGVVTIDHLESADGATISLDDWTGMFDTARGDNGTIEVYSFQEFECSDGSGAFSMKVHTTFDFSGFEFEGEQDVGRWEIESGIGPYADLSGSGDVTLDYDNDDVKYDGDTHN